VNYLRELALPAIETGLARGGRLRQDITVNTSVFVVPTDDPAEARAAEAHIRQQLSFYMSTPAYKSILAVHGWEAVSEQLGQLARTGQWDEMDRLISDEMLDAFAVSGTWAELPDVINARYGNLLDRVSYYLPYEPGHNDAGWAATIAGFKRLQAQRNQD
jgi:alkanesulfonate monooxygenase SsuD/methylene tetrahydromethanopterin reductase-like flavin-dependent oxidoreductase (luciferase family)